MHCIAFTCKEWKPNSLGRYSKNSSASKPCFVAAMFAHMLRLIECFHSRGQHLCKFIETKESVCIRKEFNSHRSGLGHQHGRRFIVLGHQYGRRDVMWKHSIIQNRFHLLLKYFSIRNSLSDVPSAPLFVDAVSIFVACAVEFQVGVLAPEDFSVSNLPLRGLPVRRSYVSCSVCMRIGLRFIDSKHCFADDEKTALHEYFGHWWEVEIAFSRMLPRNKHAPWRQLAYDVMADTIGYIQV